MDGNEPIKLSDYRGKCVLIVFWNSPTTLGRPEAVALKAVSSRVGNGDRLVVLGINCDFQGEEPKRASPNMDGVGLRRSLVNHRNGEFGRSTPLMTCPRSG